MAGAGIIVVLSIVYFGLNPKPHTTDSVTDDSDTPALQNNTETPTDTPPSPDRIARPDAQDTGAGGKIKAANCSGYLQAVNTGCFSDGECSVTVSGKHVTVLMGWSQAVVGSIIGAESIGVLEAFIGKPVEVYAKDNLDGTYTLYGSAGFYVKVVSETSTSTPPATGTGSSQASCVVSGCSSELCVDGSKDAGVSNCMYNEQFACFKTAECKRQVSGQCGWTETPALQACLVAKARE